MLKIYLDKLYFYKLYDELMRKSCVKKFSWKLCSKLYFSKEIQQSYA